MNQLEVTPHQLRKRVIAALCDVPKSAYKDRRFWSREIKLAKDAMEPYQNNAFWMCVNFGFKLKSMAWLKTPEGAKFLRDKWNIFNLKTDVDEKPVILENKIGESRMSEIRPKKQTLMEFLNG
jgi:hypothetical protein